MDQNDLHQPELTVRETFNFAARCQGTGHKAGVHLLQGFAFYQVTAGACARVCTRVRISLRLLLCLQALWVASYDASATNCMRASVCSEPVRTCLRTGLHMADCISVCVSDDVVCVCVCVQRS